LLTGPGSGDDDGNGNLGLDQGAAVNRRMGRGTTGPRACVVVGDDAVGERASGCSERAADVFRTMFQRFPSLCQKSRMATAEPGARLRAVSIACRIVRTHAMGAVGAETKYSQDVFGLWFARDTASLSPASQALRRRYITLFRSCPPPNPANLSSTRIVYNPVCPLHPFHILSSF